MPFRFIFFLLSFFAASISFSACVWIVVVVGFGVVVVIPLFAQLKLIYTQAGKYKQVTVYSGDNTNKLTRSTVAVARTMCSKRNLCTRFVIFSSGIFFLVHFYFFPVIKVLGACRCNGALAKIDKVKHEQAADGEENGKNRK